MARPKMGASHAPGIDINARSEHEQVVHQLHIIPCHRQVNYEDKIKLVIMSVYKPIPLQFDEDVATWPFHK